ncbi:MAG: hypothetical protein ACREO4_06280 [Lysobacter sp.]
MNQLLEAVEAEVDTPPERDSAEQHGAVPSVSEMARRRRECSQITECLGGNHDGREL